MRKKTAHFTGIKGVGMTALSLAFQDRGWEVQGSDSNNPQITDGMLKSRGIRVFERFTPRNVSKIEKSRWVPTIDRLIYTGAHHGAHNVEVKWAASRNIPVANYANALGEFFGDKKQICVCGVGGKTTTTAMIATILNDAGLDPSWIIGTSEIPSLLAPGHFASPPLPTASGVGRRGSGDWAVLESDEYVADPLSDRTPKFMYLSPRVIVCTNIEYDHPDVFANKEETVAAYQRFFKKLPDKGLLFLSSTAQEAVEKGAASNAIVYDKNQELRKSVEEVITVPGFHNVINAMAAVSVATQLGVPRETALVALSSFRGAKRRFEHKATVNGVDLYDDYAHHPLEIAALFRGARARFPDRRIRFIFQPHTFSRTKALFDQFSEALGRADEVVMFPIFVSAREESDPSVSSAMLADAIRKRGGRARSVSNRKELIQYLGETSRSGDVIFTVGAGNLYDIHDDLVRAIERAG